ncbi:MAG TPA: hypothetical protein VHX86_04100 [Tepidisphaeraceae bacterium]|jgi:hypothetical protein|nr:hypothetical protein [Tepidisphaeraceae bacterium]
MKFLKLAAVPIFALATLVCTSAPGDEPATRPAAAIGTSDQTQPPSNPAQIRRALRALSGRTRGVAPYTKQEWDDMMVFLQQYSPARAHVLANLDVPENAPIRLDAIRKWRNYNFTKEHFPAVADQLLKRFGKEDDLFALMLAAQSDNSQLDEYRDLIHNKVAEIVQLDFAERQTRIDKLAKMLDDEKQKFAQDQAMEDKLIDQRTDKIMSRLGQVDSDIALPTTRPQAHDELQDVADPQQPAAAPGDSSDPHNPVVDLSKDAGNGAK